MAELVAPPGPRRVLDAAMTEAELQSALIAAAKLGGWRVYHSWTSVHSTAGFPDLCMVRGGELIFAELKRENAMPSAAQAAWLDELRAVPGVRVFVWRPSDLQGAAQMLAQRPA